MKSRCKSWEYPETNRWILLVFAIYILFWWLEIGLRRPFLAAVRIEFVLGAFLGSMALFRFLTKQDRSKLNRDIVGWSIAYVLVLGAGIPFSLSPAVAYDAYVDRVLKYAIMTLLISQFVVSPAALKVFLAASFLAFLKIGQESFLGKLTGSQVWENQGVPRLHGAQGTMFGHPNSLSGKTVSVLPFLWYLYPIVRSRWVRPVILLQVMFAVNIVIFSGSRTGYIAVIMMFMIILAVSGRKARLMWFLLALTVVTATFTPVEYKERFVSTFTGEEAEGQSSQTRIDLFKDSVRVFREHPAGVGLMNFPLVQLQDGRNAQQTHNLYTQILAETGIQGFICFAGLLIVIFQKARVARRGFAGLVERLQQYNRQPRDEASGLPVKAEIETNLFLLAVANGLVVFIILRLVLGMFGHDMLEIYWWLAAGVAICLTNMLAVAEKRVEMVINGTVPANAAEHPSRRKLD